MIVDVDKTKSLVGNPEFIKEGFEAQLKSVVLLKNNGNVLPLKKNQTVYIPRRFVPATQNFFGGEIPSRWEDPVNKDLASQYFNVTDDPEQADLALIEIFSPQNNRTAGYSAEEAKKGENGFKPISLQFKMKEPNGIKKQIKPNCPF